MSVTHNSKPGKSRHAGQALYTSGRSVKGGDAGTLRHQLSYTHCPRANEGMTQIRLVDTTAIITNEFSHTVEWTSK